MPFHTRLGLSGRLADHIFEAALKVVAVDVVDGIHLHAKNGTDVRLRTTEIPHRNPHDDSQLWSIVTDGFDADCGWSEGLTWLNTASMIVVPSEKLEYAGELAKILGVSTGSQTKGKHTEAQ